MSADPALMSQLLTQQLMQPANGGKQGGQQGRISPLNAAGTLAQKVMLMRALQNNNGTAAQAQFNRGQPAAQAQMANDPTMQGLQSGAGANATLGATPQMQQLQQQMQQPLQFQDPSLMPPDGFS